MLNSQIPASERLRKSVWMVASIGLHVAVLALLMLKPTAVLVQPSSVLKGSHGQAVSLIYLAQNGAEKEVPETKQVASMTPPPRPRKKHVEKLQSHATDANLDAKKDERQAGDPNGSALSGSIFAEEVKPALPRVAPDPAITRYDLPTGFEGDVVVEVLIDERGMVTKTKLLRGIGNGLDDRIIAAVRRWQFQPAMRNGTPIPSLQDVQFHYPS